jgi:hypothetical protein
MIVLLNSQLAGVRLAKTGPDGNQLRFTTLHPNLNSSKFGIESPVDGYSIAYRPNKGCSAFKFPTDQPIIKI